MSSFAKILIIVNGVFSLTLCALLGILLAHKFDYKNLFLTKKYEADVAKQEYERVRLANQSQLQACVARLDRHKKRYDETTTQNKDLDEQVKGLDEQLKAASRETSTLESDVRSLEDRIKELIEKRTALREEINKLEKEREDALVEAKGFDQKRETLIKEMHKQNTELNEQAKKLGKLSQHKGLLEGVVHHIVKEFPGVIKDIPMPAIRAGVTAVTGDAVIVSAGRDQGVRMGGRLVIQRGNNFVALVEVRKVDRERAMVIVKEKGPAFPPVVGDAVVTDKVK